MESKRTNNPQPRSSRAALTPPLDRQVPIVFVNPEDEPIYFVNAVAVQPGSFGEIIITLGQASVPIITAVNEEEKIKAFARIRDVKAKTVVRLAFTPASLQLILTTISNALSAATTEPSPEDKADDEASKS